MILFLTFLLSTFSLVASENTILVRHTESKNGAFLTPVVGKATQKCPERNSNFWKAKIATYVVCHAAIVGVSSIMAILYPPAGVTMVLGLEARFFKPIEISSEIIALNCGRAKNSDFINHKKDKNNIFLKSKL